MFTRKPRLQLEKFAINGAKRLLQHNRHKAAVFQCPLSRRYWSLTGHRGFLSTRLGVPLMVERIKSTMTYAQIGARVGITADRTRELVARGVRMVAHGNAECSLSKHDLETARLRNRLPPWDIGLLERKLFGAAETRWHIDEA